MITYNISIYNPTETTPDFRYALGTPGQKTLLVLGLNPSTADDQKPDVTISKIMKFADKHECDSFVMLNLYAQRTTLPQNLHREMDEVLHANNLNAINNVLSSVTEVQILGAWGNLIGSRKYLKRCLSDILSLTTKRNASWFAIGTTKRNHPKHPSRAQYGSLQAFDIAGYLNQLN